MQGFLSAFFHISNLNFIIDFRFSILSCFPDLLTITDMIVYYIRIVMVTYIR